MTDDPRTQAEKDADRVAEWLEGSCMNGPIEHACETVGVKFTDEIEDLVGERVFECSGCGWWCSTDELHNDGVSEGEQHCDDCYEERGGDDDQ